MEVNVPYISTIIFIIILFLKYIYIYIFYTIHKFYL